MSKEKLLDTIEKKRLELFEVVTMKGLNSPLAIKYSQELDALLNDYDRHYIQPLVYKNKMLN
ncbi:aspartyl-phosphate phosphatase Spo0E family protein [Bacillus sp. FJAT-42315]|uniref:aspartyl-phosphate phosphatase Spo0E family protein n=1 Tax=Bacillus sp. FJAT-42315 TaxID=2014077 RepID=UPI000BA9CF47|nr:aspartyl-phosphate phosphatase Spo0E family protein [Bacillus sp. FJAT-42315]PAQ14992.1 Spo0A-P phosphatase [Bacillaceae bacterium SAOS 7]